jgi:peroxiredoxin
MRSDIVPGAVIPDYDLSDHRGRHRTLSELQQEDPLILVLARGGFCPKDRRQHEGLVLLHREMQVGYCRLVTISTDNLIETNEFRTGVGAQWTFLSLQPLSSCIAATGRDVDRPCASTYGWMTSKSASG